MAFHGGIVLAVTSLCLWASPCLSANLEPPANLRMAQAHGKLPLLFIENQESVSDHAEFVVRGPQGSAFFTRDSVIFHLVERDPPDVLPGLFPRPADAQMCSVGRAYRPGEKHPGIRPLPPRLERTPICLPEARKSSSVRISFVDPSADLVVEGCHELPGKVNYLIGNDPSKWRTEIPTYSGVAYRNVWPGINVVYRGQGKRLKYDVELSPGADIGRIKLRYDGVESLALTEAGDLIVNTAGRSFRESEPRIYQEKDKEKVWLEGGFTLDGNTVGFEVEGCDPSLVLVIDPASDLLWSTFLGGSSDDTAYAIATDSSGYAYVAGYTTSSDFPTPGGFDTTFSGNDAFIAKLDASGSALVYATFLGGTSDEAAYAIAVDSSGCAYVAGYTASSDLPTMPGPFGTTYYGNSDAFIAKLNTNGSGLVYSIYLGGTDVDEARGVAVDSSGCAYVTGRTESWDFPVTSGALDTSYNDDGNGYADTFITKVNANGSGLFYSTFLGGSKGPDEARGIAVDSFFCAYVTGATSAADFPTTAGAFDTTYNLGSDVFATKLNAAGSGLLYSTFVGGAGSEWAYGVAADAGGSAYVVGSTYLSTDFPVTAGAFDTTSNGSFDGFVTKLNAEGSAPAYSTFLGGGGYDVAYGIAVDASGCAYVAGGTLSSNFPTTPDAFDTTFNSNFDPFVSKLNESGSILLYSTFLGEGESDAAYGIALDGNGGAFVAGYTASPAFPTTPGVLGPTHNGLSDAFVVKLALPETMHISVVRRLRNWAKVEAGGGVVTASFTECFYIEADDRECGIRVRKPGHSLTVGMRTDVVGILKTNADGERYIDATTAFQNGTGSLEPLGLTNEAVGGGDWFYNPVTGAGQEGVAGGSGLNNIGVLVRTWGTVGQVGDGYLYVDDGAMLRDGTYTGTGENIGIRVICDPTGYSSGDFIEVTGISSCFKTTSGWISRRVLTRGPEDVRKLVRL